jgi:hypothetical protein
MSAPRLVSIAVLLLAACAGWENSSPSYTPPPAEGPTPSHYAPPPPGDPREPYTPPAPEQPKAGNVTVAIASVQLQEDCPDPAPAGAPSSELAPSAGVGSPAAQSMQKQAASSQMRGDTADGRGWNPCSQSTVQLSVRADFVGQLTIVAVRVLDASSKKVAGPVTLRGPTLWNDSVYGPWDGRTIAGKDLNVSYKMGEPDFSRAAELVGPTFNTFGGPFILEIEVSIDGRRQTIRSGEFTREPPHIMVT